MEYLLILAIAMVATAPPACVIRGRDGRMVSVIPSGRVHPDASGR